ncbi:MAG: PPC domain-containing DNA-binding protein [Chloroflexota bacterium]
MPTRFWPVTSARAFVGRLETGSDLVEEIERYCAEQGITAAQVTAIGAVRRARYAYYEQDARRYRELESESHHEITGFVANVSLRDGRPFLHAHATFSDADGQTIGGHLLPGIEVFAAEVMIRELAGVALIRQHDEETGLALW